MINRGCKIGACYRTSLVARNRNQRHVIKPKKYRFDVRQVLPAVKRGYRACCEVTEQREMQVVDMKVKNMKAAACWRTRSSISI